MGQRIDSTKRMKVQSVAFAAAHCAMILFLMYYSWNQATANGKFIDGFLAGVVLIWLVEKLGRYIP